MKRHRVWWSKGPKPGNLGDVLTPYILDHFGIEYKYTQKPRSARMLCIGSIAKFAGDGTIVLGSGTMRESDSLNTKADWRFVRGPRTRKAVIESGGECPEIYGDPALLMPLIQPPVQRTKSLGIVPHYVDYEYVKNKYPEENVINVLNADPLEVIRQIAECDKIISSSLHGLILAHAYDIPAAWVEFSNKLSGDGIKFVDYFESVGITDWTKSSEGNAVYMFPSQSRDISKIVDTFIEIRN